MHSTRQRTAAFFVALLSILVSLLLWAQIVRSLTATVLAPESVLEALPAVESPVAATGSLKHSAPERSSPLMPEFHYAASAASRAADSEKQSELSQWEIHEMATLVLPSLSVRSTVFLPSRTYWDARDWDTLERQMQIGLLYGLVAYPHAGPLGEKGTIIVAGHSSPPTQRARESRYGSIFAQLPSLKPGADIELRTGTKTVRYVVVSTAVVPANDTEILADQKKESILKLITCYPVGSTRERFVVTAKMVE